MLHRAKRDTHQGELMGIALAVAECCSQGSIPYASWTSGRWRRWVEGSSLETTRQTGLIPSPEQQIWHGGNVLSFSNLSHRSRLATILDGLLWIGPTIVASKSVAFTGLECEFNPKRGTSDVPPFLALGLLLTSVGLAEVVIRTRNTGSFGWLRQISGPVLSPVRYNSRVGALASVCAILISQARSSMEGNL